MKRSFRIFVSLLMLCLHLSAWASVNAWLDSDQVGSGESVQLTLQHDGRTDNQPDLTPLRQDFDILGRSTGSSIQIVNGKMSSRHEINLTLAPKHGGKIVIPSLQWDGQSTPALTLTVSSNGGASQTGSAATSNAAHNFIATTLDQKAPYVQSAVTLTVRLYADQPLYQASLEFQPSNDVLVQQLGQDRQSRETRNGRSYQVVERKYLLFPQRSGPIRLEGPVLNAQVQDARSSDPFGSDPFFANAFGHNPFAGMMNATRPLRVRSDPITLNVRPRPASGAGHEWLPAQQVTLEETWQPDSGPIHVGDPITRHLHLSARGLTASQLPDLSALMPLPAGLRAYPDQAKLDNNVQGDGVIGTRDQDIALIASHAGHFQIPALKLYWWDTTKNSQREIELPAHSLDVLPSSAALTATTAPPDQGSTPLELTGPSVAPATSQTPSTRNPWFWASLALVLLWLTTLIAWWLVHRRNRPLRSKPNSRANEPTAIGSADARKAFRQACRENDPRAARRRLLDWARTIWPNDPPIGLMALAGRLEQPGLDLLLGQLDRACYAGGEWQGGSLLEKLKSLGAQPHTAGRIEPKLAGLYP
jgi:hypothetical protein